MESNVRVLGVYAEEADKLLALDCSSPTFYHLQYRTAGVGIGYPSLGMGFALSGFHTK